MRAADLAHRLEIAVGREQDAAGADDRLAEERGDVLRPELEDRRLERLGRVPRHPGGAAGERADADLERLGADDARAVAGEAVVGALARDDHGALGLVDEAPVAAHELDDGLDRLAAAAREEDGCVVHRRDRRDPVGEIGRGAARDVAVVRVGVQLPHLRGGRIGDLGAAVADVRVPEAAGRVDVAVALVVPEVAALAALEDELAGGLHGVHVGDGVPEMGHAGQPIGALCRERRSGASLSQAR